MAFLRRVWEILRNPSPIALGLLVSAGLVGGIIFTLVFHFTMNATNSMELCISCHEMDGVYDEYKQSIHYSNKSGVRATCSDCHVPHGKTFGDWLAKIAAKATIGSKDIWHHAIGTYDTKEKFEQARGRLAASVIEEMKSRNSKECRGCHNFDAMNIDEQGRSAGKKHRAAMESGKSCIDCHTGVAHKDPSELSTTEEAGSAKADKGQNAEKK
jgi:nitrate/TMAO reductase-like tetraheme cytochrome c subunit